MDDLLGVRLGDAVHFPRRRLRLAVLEQLHANDLNCAIVRPSIWPWFSLSLSLSLSLGARNVAKRKQQQQQPAVNRLPCSMNYENMFSQRILYS